MGSRLRFREVDELSYALAAWLQHQGLKHGDRVAVMMPNLPQYMIAIPGDTPAETISAIIADEAAIGMINGKTTAVRVIPAPGKSVGDTVEFGGLLGHAPVMAVNTQASTAFIRRGGRIPAPLQALTN